MPSDGYFGHNFGPICDERELLPTPVGAECTLCEEKILDGEFGLFMAHIDNLEEPEPEIRPVHAECNLRAVMGGIEHYMAPPGHPVGSCYEGSTLSYRASARQVWQFMKMGGKYRGE